MFDSKCLLGRFVHNQTADTEILLTHSTAAGLSAIMAQMSYKLSLNFSNVIAHANGGKQPVTWETLVEVLRDIGLSTLASDISNGSPGQ